MKLIKELSVFFPAYNEEGNIEKTILSAQKILDKIAVDYEIIIIDDGSRDKTSSIIKKLTNKNKKIRLISHKTNQGYGSALRSGFYNSRFEWIFFSDSDGQFDFSEIIKFIKIQKKTNADLVIGTYIKRQVSFFRKINTFLWQKLMQILFGLKIKDIDCAFKLIRKKMIDSIPKLQSQRGAFISTELLVKAKSKGFQIIEVPVHHYPKVFGKSTANNLNVIISSLIDALKLKKALKSD